MRKAYGWSRSEKARGIVVAKIFPIDQVRLLREKYLISYFLSNSQDANRICITYR